MPQEENNEVQKFFDELPSEDKKEADIFDDKPAEPKASEEDLGKPDAGDDEEKPHKNRRHRRLESDLQRERESNIALNERVRVLSEIRAQENAPQNGSVTEMPPEWEALFGDSPESQKAWAMQSRLIQGIKEEVRSDTIREFETRQAQEEAEEREYSDFIDNELESLEDNFNVDITSDSPKARKTRREFLELVQSLSPKDESGNIIGYTDFNSTFDVYQRTKEEEKSETVSKQKEMSARSMQKSGGAIQPSRNPTPGFHGWKKDYKLD